MENIIYLYGNDYESEKEMIENKIKMEENPVFILDNPDISLHQYIDKLHDDYGMKNKTLYRFKVCKEFREDFEITYIDANGEEKKPRSMAKLLKLLNPADCCGIIVDNNSHKLLANIVQQLVYIEYPITTIEIQLRKEAKDSAKVKRFMECIDALQERTEYALNAIDEIEIAGADEADYDKMLEMRAKARLAFFLAKKHIDRAKQVELKIAVAASKKTGKSVIANSMFGMELAPTSLEMATPNSCIYKKSADDKFHLHYNNAIEDFDTEKDVYRRINREFKKAQERDTDKFTIPDMTIEYVTNKNNFESYTVYDTPGPDAAGTGHREKAEEAMKKCDVALFAIDYSKYLTDTEEDYLRSIKEQFEKQQKFHTLIFTINKMDLSLSDKGTKSRIKSIDFIRTRLQEIDKKYEDCVIFATSAQDYFYTLELEKAANKFENCKKLLDGNLFEQLRDVIDIYNDSDDDDAEDLNSLLSNIDAEVGRIHSQLGIKNVTLDVVKEYSGMPQLLNYVSYIAKSKARDEIVNSITYAIDEQRKALQVIFDYVSNVEKSINMSQDQLNRIKGIFDKFSRDVDEILKYDLTENDIKIVNYFRLIQMYAKKCKESAYGINFFEAMRDIMSEDVRNFSEREVQKDFFHIVGVIIYKKISALCGQIIPMLEVNKKININIEDVNYIVSELNKKYIDERVDSENKQIDDLCAALQQIMDSRNKKLIARIEECRAELEKNNSAGFSLPAVPEFDVAIQKSSLKLDIEPNITILDWREYFYRSYEQLGAIEQFWRNFVRFDFGNTEVRINKITYDAFIDEFRAAEADTNNLLDNMHICDELHRVHKEVAENIKNSLTQTEKNFEEMNQSCKSSIDLFRSTVDDSDIYSKDIARLENMRNLISAIKNSSEGFIKIWDEVLVD